MELVRYATIRSLVPLSKSSASKSHRRQPSCSGWSSVFPRRRLLSWSCRFGSREAGLSLHNRGVSASEEVWGLSDAALAERLGGGAGERGAASRRRRRDPIPPRHVARRPLRRATRGGAAEALRLVDQSASAFIGAGVRTGRSPQPPDVVSETPATWRSRGGWGSYPCGQWTIFPGNRSCGHGVIALHNNI